VNPISHRGPDRAEVLGLLVGVPLLLAAAAALAFDVLRIALPIP